MKICAGTAPPPTAGTIVQPVASRENTLQAIWLISPVPRVIRPHPDGFPTCSVDPCCSSNSKFFNTSIAVARCPSPRPTCGPAASDGQVRPSR